MQAEELRKKFIDFFIGKGHKQIPSASLIPEDDPTILFTPAGMSPLVRFLMGEPHPLGKRLCSVQKCLRTDDIEEVGDVTHFTFFEMLGNWSLGDYFKHETINWSFEFLIDKKWLGLDPKKIYISVFEGDKDASKDEESIKIWQEVFKQVGIDARLGDWKKPNFANGERIFTYDKSKNWWGPAGQAGPCGPDTEMFYDTGKPHDLNFGAVCHPNCDCGRFFEIWNDVFMEHNKVKTQMSKVKNNTAYEFELLKQKNVDTGMGLERVVALTEFINGKINLPDPYQTHLFNDLRKEILDKIKVQLNNSALQKRIRIFLDHSRASVFLLGAGLIPGKKDRESILRKLIRRADDQLDILFQLNQEYKKDIWKKAVEFYHQNYSSEYKELKDYKKIKESILEEVSKYSHLFSKVGVQSRIKKISGKEAFKLFATHGLSPDQLKQRGYQFDQKEFNEEMKKHQEISRKGMKQKFSGGLQDHSEEVTKLHTATHLLHAALRKILGNHVQQVGSNITQERLRFDFTHPKALTEKEIREVEKLVNEQIEKNLKVESQIMTLSQAQKQGALAFFGQRYPEKVKVYCIKDPSTDSGQPFSLEVCGGPHTNFTGELGEFRINKEESCGAGKRRIYATLKQFCNAEQ